MVVACPLNWADASYQNRSPEDQQLDDGIVDTLVSALSLVGTFLIAIAVVQGATAGAPA
jgi:hypothetical protein